MDFSSYVTSTKDVVHRMNNVTKWVDGNVSSSQDYHVASRRTRTSASDSRWFDREKLLARKDKSRSFKDAIRNEDVGHNFTVTGHTYAETPFHYVGTGKLSTSQLRWEGDLHAFVNNVETSAPVWPDIPSVDDAEMFRDGGVAISRTIPTNPTSSCYVSVSEVVRDGIPSAPLITQLKERVAHFRDLGSEYLNVQFGWKPFLSDFQNTMKAVRDSHSILSQYERDSGRNVRRRYYFPSQIDRTVTTGTGFVNPLPSPSQVVGPWNTSFPTTTTTIHSTEKWFSGCFTYHLARDSNVASRMARYAQEANRLYGLSPTPDNLWRATPWSWAADWFGDTGSVLHNLSALNNVSQVMRYGYLMCHRRTEVVYTLDARSKGGVFLEQTFGSYTKRRMRATPYGFGLNPDAFTASHWAIIGALGISRVPNKLTGWP